MMALTLIVSVLLLFAFALVSGTTALFQYRAAILPPHQPPTFMGLACICFVQGVVLAVVAYVILRSLP